MYIEALVREIELRAPDAPPTIFIGGGTPTYLSASQIERVFKGLRGAGAFADPNVEVTVEANPESATLEKLSCLRELGANRLSIGVQSFRGRFLDMFDRVHSPDTARLAVVNARSAGFRRFNLDLIFAKPGETREEWREDLENALDLEPSHLSCYELAFEEGTSLRRDLLRGRVEPQDDERCAAFYHETIARLETRGFGQYEVSAFSQFGEACRHNLVYWTGGDWIGVGAGAGSSIGRKKYLNIKNPEAYAEAVATRGNATDPDSLEISDPDLRTAELLMMGLRLTAGIPFELIERRAGAALHGAQEAALRSLIADGLLVLSDGWIVPTARGRDLGNVVAERFLPSH